MVRRPPTTASAAAFARASAPRLATLAMALVALLTCGATLGAPLTSAASGPRASTRHVSRAPSAPQLPGVDVAANTSKPGPPVPQDFLGLSFEMSALPQIARYGNRGNLVALLRSLGTGVLRFGGASADTRIAWTDNRTPRPAWASGVIDVYDLRGLAALAAASGWHVVLTVGLVHFEPVAAAREVAAAKAALGEWLVGIELGNEPNAYALHGMRSEPWTAPQYDAEVGVYRSAIEASAPGIPLLGPDVSGSRAFESWGPAELIGQRPALLTGHHYPLGCEQVPKPSITRLLSPQVRRKEIASLHRYVLISQAGNTPFRMDETNSVSCGGVAGISNTFASALWAAAYIPALMSAGAVGINLHGNPGNCRGYSPVCAASLAELSQGMLGAQPEWYAVLMAKSLIGSRPLPVTVANPHRRNMQASAFLAPNGVLQFTVVDDDRPGDRRTLVRLPVGAGYSAASVLALTGPSPAALSDVSLGGSEVESTGSWSPANTPARSVKRGVVMVALRPSSAALISVFPSVRRAGGH